MTSITATELHQHTGELIGVLQWRSERPIMVKKRGKPTVVLVNARYFEGILESLDLLSDTKAGKMLRRALSDARASGLIPHEQVVKEFNFTRSASRNKR